MLQIAVAPAAVALQTGQPMGRAFLVTAFQVVGLPDFVTPSPHQGGFDGVVAEDMFSERTDLGQLSRHGAMAHEWFQTDDRIVAPEGGIAEFARKLAPVAKSGR